MNAVTDFIVHTWNLMVDIVRQFQFKDAVDIILVVFLIYSAIKLLRETRAGQLVKGIIFLIAIYFISSYFGFLMIHQILQYLFQFAVVSIVVVFQPEIRKALEQMGRSQVGKSIFNVVGGKDKSGASAQDIKAITAVIDASLILQQLKMGALIVFEKQTKLGDIAETGTIIDAEATSQLIGNIFFNKAPLHDGAIIIREGKIYSAGCVLPLTSNTTLSLSLGTRHRAALGMSENSDAVVVVVSEETGQISVAENSKLTRDYDRLSLGNLLEKSLVNDVEESSGRKKSLFSRFGFGASKKEDKA